MIDYIVSLPPEVIQRNEYTLKSDIYSLGIIILQILTHKVNVYSDITNDCSEIIRLKKNEQLPNIPESINQNLRDLITRCLKSDPEKRPTANEMIFIIENIENDENNYDIRRLNKFILLHHPPDRTVIHKAVQRPITCKEYPLSYSNDVFYLFPPKIQPNSILTFQLNNDFRDSSYKSTYQINYFDDNQEVDVIEARYSNNEDELKLHIKDLDKVTRLHCTLKIKLSETFIVSVEIDSIIVPFVFEFELYDYVQKRYVSDRSLVYYSSKYLDREIVLHCRIKGIFFKDVNVLIQSNFCYPISIVSFKDAFVIHEDSEFDIQIKILSNFLNMNSYIYYVSANIGNIKKRITIKFAEPSINFFSYGFNWKQKEWTKLISKSDDSEDFVYIINPFNSINKMKHEMKYRKIFPFVDYNRGIKIFNSTNTIYVYLDKSGNCVNEKELLFNYNYVFNKLSIFGIAENEWYPLFNHYDPKLNSFSLLEYNDGNVQLAHNNLLTIYTSKFKSLIFGANNSADFNDFANLLKSNISIIRNLHNLIGEFPISFQKNEYYDQLQNMVDRLKTLNENDKFLPIIQNNLIFIFYTIFKKRFDEIKNNNGYIINFSNLIDESVVEQKIEDLYKEYSKIEVLDEDILSTQKQINDIESKKYLDFVKSESFQSIQTSSTQAEQNLVSKISNIQELIKKENEAKKETLIFGTQKVIKQEDFISKLQSTTTIFSTLMKNTEKDIINMSITDSFFNETQKVNDEYDNISPFLIARYSNQSECPVIQNVLNDVKVIYVDLKNKTSDLESLVNKRVFKNFSSSDV